MLPRKNLIPLKKEFPKIRAEGKMYDSGSFGLIVNFRDQSLVNKEQAMAQAAFIVSKKIDRRSVVRHEVKRKLAEGVQEFLDRLPRTTQLLFLAKQKAIGTSKEELIKEINQILQRAHLLQ